MGYFSRVRSIVAFNCASGKATGSSLYDYVYTVFTLALHWHPLSVCIQTLYALNILKSSMMCAGSNDDK